MQCWIFSVLSICCCDEKFMLHWTFSCCAEHFSLLHWCMFQQCFSCSFAEEFSKLKRQLWKVMRYLTSVSQVSLNFNNHSQCGKLNQSIVKKLWEAFRNWSRRGRLCSLWICSNRCSQTTLVPSLRQTADSAVGEHPLSCREYFVASGSIPYIIWLPLRFPLPSSTPYFPYL